MRADVRFGQFSIDLLDIVRSRSAFITLKGYQERMPQSDKRNPL